MVTIGHEHHTVNRPRRDNGIITQSGPALSLVCVGACVMCHTPPSPSHPVFPPVRSRHPVRPHLPLSFCIIVAFSCSSFKTASRASQHPPWLACWPATLAWAWAKLSGSCASVPRSTSGAPSSTRPLTCCWASWAAWLREGVPSCGRSHLSCCQGGESSGQVAAWCIALPPCSVFGGNGTLGSCCACFELSPYVIAVAVWAQTSWVCVLLCPGWQVQRKPWSCSATNTPLCFLLVANLTNIPAPRATANLKPNGKAVIDPTPRPSTPHHLPQVD